MHAVALHHLARTAVTQVRLGNDGVLAPTGKGPDQGAGFGLVKVPAGCLFCLVMPSAERMQVALTGAAALVVGDSVVVVAGDGRPSAAREPAAPAADLDHVP